MKTWKDKSCRPETDAERRYATVDGATIAVNLVCEGAEDRLRLWLTFLVVAGLRGVLYDVTLTTDYCPSKPT